MVEIKGIKHFPHKTQLLKKINYNLKKMKIKKMFSYHILKQVKSII